MATWRREKPHERDAGAILIVSGGQERGHFAGAGDWKADLN